MSFFLRPSFPVTPPHPPPPSLSQISSDCWVSICVVLAPGLPNDGNGCRFDEELRKLTMKDGGDLWVKLANCSLKDAKVKRVRLYTSHRFLAPLLVLAACTSFSV